jgi:myo-inositol catabolism protein IolH
VVSVCVFGWHEDADNINRRMLQRIQTELNA